MPPGSYQRTPCPRLHGRMGKLNPTLRPLHISKTMHLNTGTACREGSEALTALFAHVHRALRLRRCAVGVDFLTHSPSTINKQFQRQGQISNYDRLRSGRRKT